MLILQWILGIPVIAGQGVFNLAVGNITAPRIGTTKELDVTAIYTIPNPGLPNTKQHKHQFELGDLNADYKFIIGQDLIWFYFNKKDSVPYDYLHREKKSNVTMIQSDIDDDQLDTMPVSVFDNVGQQIPEEEQPAKPIMETEPQLEQEYKRKRLLVEKSLNELLTINAAITGFCSLPEAEVVLIVDPTKKLYRKQYKLPNAAEPTVTEIVNRWLSEGKIEIAPNNCEYNNPLLVVPKKNSEGEIIGGRVCLDTRILNDALLIDDKFPLPYVNDILETFGGKCIYGELDLSEAYLQFPVHKIQENILLLPGIEFNTFLLVLHLVYRISHLTFNVILIRYLRICHSYYRLLIIYHLVQVLGKNTNYMLKLLLLAAINTI